MHGLILFAHGARDERWSAPFKAIAQRVVALRPDLQVRLAYLELMEPSLLLAADELAAQGCTSVRIQPLFLGTGGHLRRDLPLQMAELIQRHPQIVWTQQAAVGELDSVQQAMAEAAVQSFDSSRP